MPKILEAGKSPQVRRPWNLVFTCDKCGCKFGILYGTDDANKLGYKQGEDRPNGDFGYWTYPCPQVFIERACIGTGTAYDVANAKTWEPDAIVQRRVIESQTVPIGSTNLSHRDDDDHRVLPPNQRYP